MSMKVHGLECDSFSSSQWSHQPHSHQPIAASLSRASACTRRMTMHLIVKRRHPLSDMTRSCKCSRLPWFDIRQHNSLHIVSFGISHDSACHTTRGGKGDFTYPGLPHEPSNSNRARIWQSRDCEEPLHPSGLTSDRLPPNVRPRGTGGWCKCEGSGPNPADGLLGSKRAAALQTKESHSDKLPTAHVPLTATLQA